MKSKLIIAGILLALPLASNAAFIEGELFMGGAGDATCSGGGACSLAVADGLSFAITGNLFSVSGATGDFAADNLGFGDTGTISDFDFADIPPGVQPLWTIAAGSQNPDGLLDWSFDLLSLNIDDQFVAGDGTEFLNLSGMGLISATGYDDTEGTWTLSADDSNPGNIMFAWSSTTVASEPGILLVFGFGLFGLIAARRFHR